MRRVVDPPPPISVTVFNIVRALVLLHDVDRAALVLLISRRLHLNLVAVIPLISILCLDPLVRRTVDNLSYHLFDRTNSSLVFSLLSTIPIALPFCSL